TAKQHFTEQLSKADKHILLFTRTDVLIMLRRETRWEAGDGTSVMDENIIQRVRVRINRKSMYLMKNEEK
ncbi:MAG: hypothetical protein ACI4PL_08890, partial [Faecousia sp.]